MSTINGAQEPLLKRLEEILELAESMSDDCDCVDKHGPDEVICTICKITERADYWGKKKR